LNLCQGAADAGVGAERAGVRDWVGMQPRKKVDRGRFPGGGCRWFL
jgi:hypothetical protein